MNLFNYIEKYSNEASNLIALVDGNTTITYNQLYNCLRHNQKLLKENGYKEGQSVILKARKQLDFAVAFLSLLTVECWIIPVHLDITDIEMQKIIELTNGRVLNEEIFEQLYNFEEDEKITFMKPAEDKTGIYHLTSGTTGTSKLCIRTLESLMAEGESFKTTLSIKEGEKILSVSPLYHSYALGAALMASMVSGGCLYTIDAFIPRKVLKIIHENKISILILVPIMARALCTTYTERTYDLSSLRIPLVGAGAITEELYNNFKQKYGVALLSNYGSTETGGIISRLEPLPFTSIGKPMDGVEVKICNSIGQSLGFGEEGAVWVKCNAMLKSYFNINDTIFDEQGFFSMGDIAVQDKDNYLYILGRKKLFINSGGKKVDPYEVENIILSFQGIKECAVVGISKSSGEEAVKAVVVGDGIEDADLRRYCSEKLSNYKIPSIIEFRKALPKNELGKIKREELKSPK